MRSGKRVEQTVAYHDDGVVVGPNARERAKVQPIDEGIRPSQPLQVVTPIPRRPTFNRHPQADRLESQFLLLDCESGVPYLKEGGIINVML